MKLVLVLIGLLLSFGGMASARDLFPVQARFTGQATLTTFQRSGLVAGRVDVDVAGALKGLGYSLETRYPGVRVETSFDGWNQYTVATPLNDPAAGKGVSHALPTVLSSERFPMNASLTERAVVLLLDVLIYDASEVEYDPFLDPRLHMAFEAVTPKVSASEEGKQ